MERPLLFDTPITPSHAKPAHVYGKGLLLFLYKFSKVMIPLTSQTATLMPHPNSKQAHSSSAADARGKGERKEKVFQYELVGVNSLITGSVSPIA